MKTQTNQYQDETREQRNKVLAGQLTEDRDCFTALGIKINYLINSGADREAVLTAFREASDAQRHALYGRLQRVQ